MTTEAMIERGGAGYNVTIRGNGPTRDYYGMSIDVCKASEGYRVTMDGELAEVVDSIHITKDTQDAVRIHD